MKRFLVLIACFSSALIYCSDNNSTVFAKDRLVTFYDEYLLEEKELLAEGELTSGASSDFVTDPFNPPPNPPAPPFKNGLLPIVLVNNSGYPDSQVYVVVTGENSSSKQSWGNINTNFGSNFGVATLQAVTTGDNGSTFSCALSSLPRGSTGRVIYLPPITSGIIWFSMLNKLNMPVVDGDKIQNPSYTNTSDPNYATSFDSFEIAYVPGGSPQVSADATAVSAFSIPLYTYLSGATSVGSNTGLYQPRSYIMKQLASAFSQAPESSQWNKLLLEQNGKILRCLSPGESIAASGFDENYLDNSSAYGYSYINDLWNGSSAYYKTNTLTMVVKTTAPAGTFTYTGQPNGSNEFTFTSTDPGNPGSVVFQAPTTGSGYVNCTTYNILEGLNLVDPINQPTAGTAADAISKLFQEAIVAGILPTASTLSLDSLVNNQSGYYKVNPLLTSPGETRGPWYDLYSKALHSLALIYTFAYDDALWPQVLLGGPFNNNSTYIGITIGNSK